MKCPYCKHDLAPGQKSCPWCGRTISPTKLAEELARDRERAEEEKIIEQLERGTCTFPVVTMSYIPGYEIVRVIGPVYGLTVRARGFGGQIAATFQQLVGGEITAYTSECIKARNESLARLILNAKKMGANAVVKVDFETSDIAGIVTIFSAYGTAVIIKPAGETRPQETEAKA